MTEQERHAAAIAKLHRMIVYVREEAARLRVMDVALLLDRAEETMTTFAPTAPNRHGAAPSIPDASRVEH